MSRFDPRNKAVPYDGSIQGSQTVTPSDADDLLYDGPDKYGYNDLDPVGKADPKTLIARAIIASADATVRVTYASGVVDDIPIAGGIWHPMAITKLHATGTTAGGTTYKVGW